MFTHKIVFTLNHKTLGQIKGQSFRTTADAVNLHLQSMAQREAKGEVCDVVVELLAA